MCKTVSYLGKQYKNLYTICTWIAVNAKSLITKHLGLKKYDHGCYMGGYERNTVFL